MAQKEWSECFRSIDSLLTNEIQKEHFSGSLVITNTNGMRYEKTAGLANRTWNIPVDEKTKFDIASVNKLFIATLTLMAVEEGKISLKSRLVDLLAHVEYSGQFNKKITIHQMLSHTSGLPDYDAVANQFKANNFNQFKRKRFSKNESYVDFISQLPIVAEPGEQFYYSNFAYHLLPMILEDLYKMPFQQLLAEKISLPLGLQNTYSSTSNEEVIDNLAIGYIYDQESNNWLNNDFIDLTLGRRIFSNAHDLNLFAQALLTNKLLADRSFKQLTSNHLKNITDQMAYGYGIVPYGAGDDYRMGDLGIGLPYLIHGGNTEGFRSMLVIINKGEWIITLTGNSGNRLNEMEITKKLANLITQ